MDSGRGSPGRTYTYVQKKEREAAEKSMPACSPAFYIAAAATRSVAKNLPGKKIVLRHKKNLKDTTAREEARRRPRLNVAEQREPESRKALWTQ